VGDDPMLHDHIIFWNILEWVSGHDYLFVNGQWYVAPSYNGPWIRIAVHRLPGPIRAAHVYHGRHYDWHRWH
jgi:hypothetical protein